MLHISPDSKIFQLGCRLNQSNTTMKKTSQSLSITTHIRTNLAILFQNWVWLASRPNLRHHFLSCRWLHAFSYWNWMVSGLSFSLITKSKAQFIAIFEMLPKSGINLKILLWWDPFDLNYEIKSPIIHWLSIIQPWFSIFGHYRKNLQPHWNALPFLKMQTLLFKVKCNH